MLIQTINPANGKIVQTFEQHSSKQVNEIIGLTHEAFLNWRNAGFSVRKVFMKKASAILREKKNEFGKILTLEMGKPIVQAIAEVEKCALVCDYYAENAENILSEEIIATDASESFVCFDPLGIVLAVMPWNFPFWQVFRFAAPALMAGNACLLKHASNVPMSALAIEELFSQAGFPQNVFRTLLIGSSAVEKVINHPKIKAVTLTGSEPAGKKVAESCGKVLKKTVLELGGSDPFIVLEDAAIDAAVKTAITARLINNGQSCIAAKRFIVVEKVYDEFEKKFVELMNKVKIGDPMNPETELGPIAREDLLFELEDQVQRSVQSGAKILCGGKRIAREGFYFEATILANVLPGTPAYEEEIFGPVATLIKAVDEEDAIRIANDSQFGLGASLWTSNIEKAKRLAARIESGSVFINGMVKSDPRLPFGGIKNSGYGREISHYGIKEFVNIKTVWIK
ncbi:MAG: succinate-semialdehyde dehydrogenase [Stygiobacter sp. RIFOXYC12_FULL_38_8]|nr:MAG: succinate-semialdehyde dehydrogenase [Stygiobacter sp. GWC2_38_9]OGV08575.1 MAG: succinate-semialdehyde dehydrogenase [Stygiobacter sp. RIFOXYB2_FULL_37_11]OGV11803.1 MAG: succinate-semialdehyde dehydrogenase [Stygiobacter sp. RIFOXYA2_FULL_38_8]OGV12538.1 MAG: succinate-semialdehyde dehydrogenase [Stygiobacter sp. RIFOXYC2_FULL_38_25]OGV23560.1 MAG: succinate-semialdehyde dehydrogenase [Stygiobacter sp. RIFOXYC12_FULL_38_8]OGV78803.1 MAG: succinate-semialdehyde dehydrogenase [Stygioba